MILIEISRIDMTDKGIFGQLRCEEFNCVTLERHDIAIPAGTYKVTLYKSPVHGLVPLVNGVKGRSWIELHAGNWEKDSKGCILVGERRDGDAIDNSKKTIEALVKKIQGANDICLKIA